jgi:hypothetical protein
VICCGVCSSHACLTTLCDLDVMSYYICIPAYIQYVMDHIKRSAVCQHGPYAMSETNNATPRTEQIVATNVTLLLEPIRLRAALTVLWLENETLGVSSVVFLPYI